MAQVERRDLTLWAAEQAVLLRQGRVGEIDVRRLADEIADLGLRQERSLRDHLEALACRLVMWKFLPGARLPSWRDDVDERRGAIAALLASSPSLADRLDALFVEAYRLGQRRAAAETGIDVGLLPETPPFTLEEARDEGFLPLEPGIEFYKDHHRIDDHVADEFL